MLNNQAFLVIFLVSARVALAVAVSSHLFSFQTLEGIVAGVMDPTITRPASVSKNTTYVCVFCPCLMSHQKLKLLSFGKMCFTTKMLNPVWWVTAGLDQPVKVKLGKEEYN